ncbi:MAG: ATP-binding protein [Acidobacteria bacterium]|nr:ATP-binding protein [Acidobacteriota bacterium]
MQMIQRYVAKISGPLMDRIDIHIDVPAVRVRELSRPSRAESSSTVRERVVKARRAQLQCFIDDGIYANSQMTPRQIRKYCLLRQESQTILENAINRLGLSARAYDRVLKVSRTIADLEGSEHIESPRVSEAIQYRSLDRTYWK